MFAFSLNIPTPIVVQKDAEVAFPCQNRPCGCQNAQQCWGSCCCFSDAQKLAWAQANQVTPPDWFLEKIADEALLAKLQPTRTVPHSNKSTAKKVCCCCCHSAKPALPAEQSPAGFRKTIAVRTTIQQLLGCQGKLELLKKQIVYLLPSAHQPTAQPYRQNLPLVSESVTSLAIAPPVPPS